jgi:hypothetical protein
MSMANAEHAHSHPIQTLAELKTLAAAVAEELAATAGADDAVATSGGGSRHRALPEDVRRRLLEVRDALYRRGIFDPVLARFDTASAAQATTSEIAERLGAVAAGL